MNTKAILILVAVAMVSSCSKTDSDEGVAADESGSAFGVLPTSTADQVSVSGDMSFWMYEGDAGCYGNLTKGGSEIQLWVDADKCGNVEYEENAPATLVITFNPNEQWGPGKTYTIVDFK